MSTPNPADDLPAIGSPARRALEEIGVTRLSQIPKMSKSDLLSLHGVGPKAIGILEKALSAKGLSFRKSKTEG